jgi:hypothetical protein
VNDVGENGGEGEDMSMSALDAAERLAASVLNPGVGSRCVECVRFDIEEKLPERTKQATESLNRYIQFKLH